MRYARVAGLVFNQPLLIEPGALRTVLAYLVPRLEGREPGADPARETSARRSPGACAGVEFLESFPDGRARPYQLTSQGVALLPIEGELVHRASWLDAASGLTGYEGIAARLEVALADPLARAVLLDLHSPGGMVHGCFELARRIEAARAVKPVWALANAEACSAAYALACAAGRVLVTQSAAVGSIGVIWQHLDQSDFDRKNGLKYTPIFAGERKNDFNPHEPPQPEALAWATAEVERLYGVFCGLVARCRGLSEEAVRATQAGLFFGPGAVAAGLADQVSNLAEALEELGRAANPSPGTAGGPAATREEAVMSDEERERAAAGGAPPDEKARIKAILAAPEAKGREELARHLALETGLEPEAARAVLACAPAAAGARAGLLAAAMGRVANPEVGPDPGEAGEAPAGALAARMKQQVAARQGQREGR